MSEPVEISKSTRITLTLGTIMGIASMVCIVMIWLGVLVPPSWGQEIKVIECDSVAKECDILTEDMAKEFVTREKLEDTNKVLQNEITTIKSTQSGIKNEISQLNNGQKKILELLIEIKNQPN